MDETRRKLIKAVVFGVPAVLSLQAVPAFAKPCMTGRDSGPRPTPRGGQKRNEKIKTLLRGLNVSRKRSL